MYLKGIKEVGATNILRWAMANGADLKKDSALQILINDEMAYVLDIGDVNLLELFRLAQLYRDKLRVKGEHPAAIPEDEALQRMFPGKCKGEEDQEITLSEVARTGISAFMNTSLQMNTDTDIIEPGAARLFFPMICRKYNIQIPMPFMQVINAMEAEEVANVFGPEYPHTLEEFAMTELTSLNNRIMLTYAKATDIARYTKEYDNYLKNLVYAPLSTYTGSELFKFVLNAFSKYDPVGRANIRCSMFHQNSEIMKNIMKSMSRQRTPLECDFTIQLPIQYMCSLVNTFSPNELPVRYESSMSDIIDSDLMYHNFVTPAGDPEDEDVKKRLNEIEAYKVRINEANRMAIAAIPMIMNSDGDIDVTATFAILPAIYSAKAVITVTEETIPQLIARSDSVLYDMFTAIQKVMRDIAATIDNT